MPETTRISFKEWLDYAKSVLFKTCHETSRASLGRGLFASLSAAIGRWLFGFMAQHEIWAQVLIFIGAGVVVYLGEFLIRLFFTPAKMEKEAREKLAEIELDRNRALKLGNICFDKEESEHIKAALRKTVKEQLGLYLRIIEHQIFHVELMDWIAATQADREKEILYWSDVKADISKFLIEKVSDAEAAKFESIVGMQQTPVNGDDEFSWPQKQRQLFLIQMTHNAKQLLSIIENLRN